MASQSRQLEAPAGMADSVQTSIGSRSGVSLVSGAEKYLDRSSENRMFLFLPVTSVRLSALLLPRPPMCSETGSFMKMARKRF